MTGIPSSKGFFGKLADLFALFIGGPLSGAWKAWRRWR